MEKVCMNCQQILKKGRSDMKFCSTQCRSEFNNRKNKENDLELLRINSILRKNRAILKNINPVGMTVIRREVLLQSGFNFEYYTNSYTAKNGNLYNFCYEYGYHILDNEKIRIVNKQNYVNSKKAE